MCAVGVTGSMRSIAAATPETRLSVSSVPSVRERGYATGVQEARRFLDSTEPDFEQPVAYVWLDRIVTEGRRTLREAGTPDQEIEIWDNACRIMFLLATLRE